RDLRVQRRVVRLLGGDVVVHRTQAADLEQVEQDDQPQDRETGEHDQAGHPAVALALEDIGGEEVDLAHRSTPGIASPTATARTGSASAAASSGSSEDNCWKTRPGSTGTGMRWRI